jgi:hypothetical protein
LVLGLGLVLLRERKTPGIFDFSRTPADGGAALPALFSPKEAKESVALFVAAPCVRHLA